VASRYRWCEPSTSGQDVHRAEHHRTALSTCRRNAESCVDSIAKMAANDGYSVAPEGTPTPGIAGGTAPTLAGLFGSGTA
jgi:hypothetical protein